MVSGYYGFTNLGDEAILATLCTDLLALGFKREEIVVLSHNPQLTELEHGVVAIPRYDLKRIWHTLGSTRLLVSGGGSLLQDVTSKRSIPYYLAVVELAMLRKVPVVMYGQGLGPVHSKVLRTWVRRAFQRGQACSVRDQSSVQFLTELGVPREKVILAADPVFQQEPAVSAGQNSSTLLLNIRPYPSWNEHKAMWVDHLTLWHEMGFSMEFAPIGPGDREIGDFLHGEFPELEVHPLLTLEDYPQVFQRSRLCISMRLHGLIFSALNDCLPVGINYDPKVQAISTQLGIPFWELTELESLGRGVGQVLNREQQHRVDYQRALIDLRKRALQNRQVLAEVLR